MSKNVDEFFDLQDVIGNALKSIGGDMDDITGDIVINGDEDVFTMSLYSTVDKKDARNFKKKFFDTIEKALSSTRFNDVSRDENYTFAYQLSENDLSHHIGPRAAKEFKDKFAMFEILVTAYADREELKESSEKVEVPAPYNKYFEVSDFEPEPEDYQIGEVIEGYDARLLAYLEVKQEYIEETDIQPVLIDDKDYPVVEIVGSRLIPVNLNAIFVNDDDVEDLEESINETYWIDNKEVMDKVHSLQDELEADGWTQNGDRYTGSKYYSFYMKRGGDKALWKAIRYSHTDDPEIIDVTYQQAIGSEPLDDIDGLRRDLGRMLLPKRESVQEYWDDLESINDDYDANQEDCSWKQIASVSFEEALTSEDSEQLKAFLTSLLDDNVFEKLDDADRKYAEAQTRKFLDKLKGSLNESPRGFYVTTYWPDEKWSPEEGGTMDYGWQADESKFFRSEQEAQEYLDNQLIGMNIKTKYDGSYQYEDEYGDLRMIAIEPSGKRGRWHSPARSWTQAEFDDPVERPYFDRKGSRVERNPRLVAKERKEAKALENEFRDAVANATTKEELIEIATDAKFMHIFSDIGSILVDKFREFN